MVREDIDAGLVIRPFGDAEVVMRNAYWIVRSENSTSRSAVDKVIEWLKLQATNPAIVLADRTT